MNRYIYIADITEQKSMLSAKQKAT